MAVSIDLATDDDVPALVASHIALSVADSARHDPYTDQEWADREGAGYFAALVRAAGCVVLLARRGDAVLGHLVGRMRTPSTLRPVRVAELESMQVHPAYRGQGVGTQLVREFFGWARGQGAERAAVTAYAANDGAQRFYRRHGFAPKTVSLEAGVPPARLGLAGDGPGPNARTRD